MSNCLDIRKYMNMISRVCSVQSDAACFPRPGAAKKKVDTLYTLRCIAVDSNRHMRGASQAKHNKIGSHIQCAWAKHSLFRQGVYKSQGWVHDVALRGGFGTSLQQGSMGSVGALLLRGRENSP